ncbi:MAG: apolipoprotein N-acyltransferase [Rubrivivax sp.]
MRLIRSRAERHRRGRLGLALDAAVVVALGALQTLAYTHTAWWPLPIATLAWLVWRLEATAPVRAALLSWLYGTAWLVAGTWWLYISLHRYGGLPAPLAVTAVWALSAALSIYLALAGWAYARWRRGAPGDVALFAALWLLAEAARALVFTGFPWVALGYSQVDAPLAAAAPWVGVYGIGALMAALAAAVVRWLRGGAGKGQARRWVPLAGLLVLATALSLAPRDFTRSSGALPVTLLQTNVPQDQKFDAAHLEQNLSWTVDALMNAPPGLAVAPETAVPLLPSQLADLAPGLWEGLRSHFAQAGRAALVGVPLGDFDRGYTNSVVGLSASIPATSDYRYDKHHLVPFGEFIPTGFRWFTQLMEIPLGDFNRGVVDPPSFEFGGQRIAPNICYEDLYGEELARRFEDPAQAPTVFANVSNLGWFGDSSALPQHLNISRMRSLELQRPMVRATNTGATAFIDHRGVVMARLPAFERGVLTATVDGRNGTTPFAWWAARGGLWPLIGLALLVVAAAALRFNADVNAKIDAKGRAPADAARSG